nr:site-specific integrase [Paenactinomyces guangxiensis]
MTFNELLFDWLKNVKPKVKKTTFSRYNRIVNFYISDTIGRIRLAELKPIHISRFYAEKELSPNSIKAIHNVVNGSLGWAVKMKLIKENPAAGIELPRPKPRNFNVWTPEEINRFLEVARPRRAFPIYYLTLMTGMRRGEVLGLKWEDIDFENSIIHVSRSWTVSDKVKIIHEGGKTANSRRSIHVSRSVLDVLKIHRERQQEEHKQLGITSDFVFTTGKGELYHPDTISEFFHETQQAAGVPRIRFHDLRHTHASILLQKGVHPKIVSERLGHSSISITLDIYSHLIPTIQKEAADAIESFMGDVGKM